MNCKQTVNLTLLFGVIIFTCSRAMATPVIDGVFDRSGEWAGNHTSEDYVRSSDGWVGPGWGGQAFDIEHIGIQVNSSTVYFGIQSGYNFADPPSTRWLPGDFAINVDGDDQFEYAIDFTIIDDDITYKLIDMTTGTSSWQDPYFTDSGPWQASDTSTVVSTWTDNNAFGSGHYSQSHRSGETDISYIVEGSFDLSLLDLYTGGDLTIHWTMGCGNDVLKHTTSPAPVPEPATMLLFGTGLAGLATVRRKKRHNK